ncbi:DDX49 helicase, partial [Bucco capensis]|nr:DDX49 helicase [Bucco capensis]
MAEFRALGLAPWLVEQARQVGLSRPTPVQAACIPAVLQGRDCMGCAKTGSGKTAAFVLPVLQVLSEDPYGIFCLVLTPTRELAYQIAEQFRVLGKPLGLKDCVVVGGLGECHSLGASPWLLQPCCGWLRKEQGAQRASRSTWFALFRLRSSYLVLDEADRLLEQGCSDFTADLEVILDALPAQRQTLLFSATLTDTLNELKSLAANRPFLWEAKSEVRTVEELDQHYLLVPEAIKDAYLIHLIQTFQDQHKDWAIIVFTKTCKDCQVLNMMLRKFSFPSIALHSMMKQRQRFAALAKFKSSISKILLATDVAAR